MNVASRRVMEKAGLRLVRAFHQPWPFKIEGDEEGDVEYALLRREWEQTTAEATGRAGHEGLARSISCRGGVARSGTRPEPRTPCKSASGVL